MTVERLRRHAGPLAGLLLLSLFAYFNSLNGAFVFDDVQHVRDNPLIRDLANYLANTSGYRAMPNRFIAYLSFAVNYRLGGLGVTSYHLFNLGVHVLCAVLLYALVDLSFQTPRLKGSSLAPWAHMVAFAAAALFVTHPVQTQAVTYIVQRITSLATLLYLLAVVLYVYCRLSREEQPPHPARSRASYALALLAAVAAMKTKEIAFTLPFALVLFELFFFDRMRSRLPFLLPFLATALIIPATLLDLHRPAAQFLGEVGERTHVQTAMTRLDYLRTQAAVVVTYLRLLFLPVGQNIDHDYPIYRSFLAPRVIGSLAVLASLLAAAGWLCWRSTPRGPRRALDPGVRLVSFGVVWFFLTMLVESSVIPILDVVNEHRIYLPSIGFFMAAATAAGLLLRRIPRVDPARLTWLMALLLAITLAVGTQRRNEVWADDLSLWADAVVKSPAKARPVYNLGSALATAGHPERAVRALRRAVSLDPGLAPARAQLGATLLALGRIGDAEPELREAVRIDPGAPEPIFNLAMLLSTTRRAPEAAGWYRRFLEVAPPSYASARQVAAGRARPPSRSPAAGGD